MSVVSRTCTIYSNPCLLAGSFMAWLFVHALVNCDLYDTAIAERLFSADMGSDDDQMICGASWSSRCSDRGRALDNSAIQ